MKSLVITYIDKGQDVRDRGTDPTRARVVQIVKKFYVTHSF